MISLKGEHEALRAYLRELKGWLDGLDAALDSPPEERLRLVRERISNLYYGLLHLRDAVGPHTEKDKATLFPRLEAGVAQELEKQHEHIHNELNRVIGVIAAATPKTADIDHLRDSVRIVKEAFNQVAREGTEHMAEEDRWIDTLSQNAPGPATPHPK